MITETLDSYSFNKNGQRERERKRTVLLYDQKIIRPQTNLGFFCVFFFWLLEEKKAPTKENRKRAILRVRSMSAGQNSNGGNFLTEECSHNEMVIFQLQFKFKFKCISSKLNMAWFSSIGDRYLPYIQRIRFWCGLH